MHQHPRRSPVTASPANSPRTNPTRTNNQREEKPPSRAGSEKGAHSEQSEGVDAMMRAPEPSHQGNDPIGKLNQIVQNYFTKAVLTVLNARVPLPPAFHKDKTKRINKWYNVEIDETDVLKDYVRIWRTCGAIDDRPPPMVLEVYIDTQELTNSQSLVFIDDYGRKWDVEEALNASPGSEGSDSRPEVILERWIMQLSGGPPKELPPNLSTILPRTYKNSIVLFRSLFTCARIFPVWKIAKKFFGTRSYSTMPKLRFRISRDPKLDPRARRDNLTVPLCAEQDDVVDTYAFDPVDSPAGPFSIHVTYRTSCDFQLDDSEAFLSSRFMGMDEPFDRPPARRLESAPTHRYMDEMPRQKERPSYDQAYGSMSTFHGGLTGTSPISALRNAQFSESPESKKPEKSSLRTGESVARRPSVSFMPFKAPSLSASPSQETSYPKGSLGKSSPLAVLAEARHPSGPPRGSPKTDHSRNSSSNSPKPPAPQRYSSSFGHRKAKLSTGGSKTEDDTSSGKASASSAQGVLAEGGTSSGSIQTDDDNISDFLKMLDQKKDLIKTSPQGSPSDAATRRTGAQLNKFYRMRESNTALTESITSSQLLHRSSTSSSRQLGSVPPMVAATSLSTSSSPGKPISPHTPHTPAIPSRLSANSVADYTRPPRSNLPEGEEQPQSPPGAIDIPSSPRLNFHPSYRRSSSAAQGHRTLPFDDDENIFPFFMRSSSLDVDDRPPPSRSALIGPSPNQDEAVPLPPRDDDQTSLDSRPTFGPPLRTIPSLEQQQRPASSSDDQQASPSPQSRRGFPYRPRVGSRDGRVDAQSQQGSSPASRAEPGFRFSSSRSRSRPQSVAFEEEEDSLLFALQQ